MLSAAAAALLALLVVPPVVAAGAVVAAGVVGAAVGGAAGAGARVVLGRLRRGASIRPGWCEAAVGALWFATGCAWAAGTLPGPWVPALLALGWFGVAAGSVDVVHRRLPDALTLPAFPVALLLVAPLGPDAVLRGAAGAAAAVAVHALVHLVAPGAMGAGDVKLAAPLGAVLAAAAWPALVVAAVLAAVLTAGAGFGCLARRRSRGRSRRGAALPHGPSMLLAAWLVTGWLAIVGTAGHAGGG